MPNSSSKRKISVLIADDHQVIREGLSAILQGKDEIEIIGFATDGSEAVRMSRELSPDVVLMDISMPNVNGIEATKRIKAENPGISIVILTMYEEEQYIFELVRAGASGFLLKDAGSGQILSAIKSVARGGSVLNPAIAHKILTEFSRLPHESGGRDETEKCGFSKRELAILSHIADGRSNKEIACELGISEKTIKNHVTKIFHKLGVKDRTKAVITAIKKGLLDLK